MARLAPATPEQVLDAVRGALADGVPLEVLGAGTKRGFGRPMQTAAALDLSGLSGIVAYEPEELVVTCRAGTRQADLEAALAERRQCLAFEPADWGPLFGAAPGAGTIGGVVAANLAGPRRISHGAARDHVLGLACVSGLGEAFVCGGRVVKNVTGFDLPKLLTGSLGTLAVISEITLRVAPLPETTATVVLRDLDDRAAVAAMTAALSSPHEVSGAAHVGTVTALRIEGPPVSVAARAGALSATLGSTETWDGERSRTFWTAVRDVTPFAAGTGPLWRLFLPPAAAAAAVSAIRAAVAAEVLYDRGGAQVWLATASPAADIIRAAAQAAGGQATLVRAPTDVRAAIPPFHPEPPALARLSERLKQAFDPRRILNPGRRSPAL